MDSSKGISVVILGAGFSVRMGSEKFALKFDDTHSFLEEIVETYTAFGCDEIVVVLSQKGMALKDTLGLKLPERVMFIENEHPEKERFYSLQTGLKALENSDFVFIQNIDNPFIDKKILKQIFNVRNENAYSVPYYNEKGGHPILVPKKIIKAIMNSEHSDVKLNVFLKQFQKVKLLIGNECILYNINNVEIYEQIIKKNRS